MTAGLTVYTLRSKTDFSYLGAGLGAALWVLLLGGLLAMFVPGMHLALAMGGAVLFSAYIVRSGRSLVSPPLSPASTLFRALAQVYDVHMIANRCRGRGAATGTVCTPPADRRDVGNRLSPDEYIHASISLYLDIVNLFLHLLRILSELHRD